MKNNDRVLTYDELMLLVKNQDKMITDLQRKVAELANENEDLRRNAGEPQKQKLITLDGLNIVDWDE